MISPRFISVPLALVFKVREKRSLHNNDNDKFNIGSMQVHVDL